MSKDFITSFITKEEREELERYSQLAGEIIERMEKIIELSKAIFR